MKYAVASTLALVLSIAAGIALTRRISAGKEYSPLKKILITAAVSMILIAAVLFAYLEVYYHADGEVKKYLKSGSGVKVSESKDAYFFDGPGSESAVVFYPGAKVEETSYAPLMFRLARQGTDCFLLKLPFRMAIFEPNAADDVTLAYDYDHWYLMGHSLGGIVAAEYDAKNTEETDGVILLASYPTVPVPNSERLLSIYGTNDGCLSRNEYRESKGLWPRNRSELIIRGGNHAGFGYYGPQKGDGEAEISPYEQQSWTVDSIVKFVTSAQQCDIDS